jgi:hypothetical protein
MERIITIAESRLAELRHATASLVRTARRLGLSPEPSMIIDQKSRREQPQIRETNIIDGSELLESKQRHYVVAVVDCILTVPDGGVKAPGQWSIAGTLERTSIPGGEGQAPRAENEIFSRPQDRPKLEAFRLAPLKCDHCRVARHRVNTIVVQDAEGGKMLQLGKECATAYLGDRYDQEVAILQFDSFLSQTLDPFKEGAERGVGGARPPLQAWDADEVTSHACAAVRSLGWEPGWLPSRDTWSPRQRNPNATADVVRDTLNGIHLQGEALAERRRILATEQAELISTIEASKATNVAPVLIRALERRLTDNQIQAQKAAQPPPYEIEEQDRTKAAELIDWIRGQAIDPEKNQYLAELQAAFAPGWVSDARLGFAVSVVTARESALKREAQEQKRANSQHVAKKGDKIEFNAKLHEARAYGGDFPGTAYSFYDENGCAISWLTSTGGLFKQIRLLHPEMDETAVEAVLKGANFRLRATVKDHEIFRGEKTTKVKNLKVLEVLPDLAPAPPESEPELVPVPSLAPVPITQQKGLPPPPAGFSEIREVSITELVRSLRPPVEQPEQISLGL